MRVLEPGGERADPSLFRAVTRAIAAAQTLHLPQAGQLQHDPGDEAGIALLPQKLEIGRVVGAALVLHLDIFDRYRTAFLRAFGHDVFEAVAPIGVEPAAEGIFAHIVDRPFPHCHASRGGLVAAMLGDGRHPLPIAGGQEGQRHEAECCGARDIGDTVLHCAQQQHAQHRDAEEAGARLRPNRDQQAGENQAHAEQLHAPIGRKDAPIFHQPGDQRRHPDRHRG